MESSPPARAMARKAPMVRRRMSTYFCSSTPTYRMPIVWLLMLRMGS